jgi:hypothetical protein
MGVKYQNRYLLENDGNAKSIENLTITHSPISEELVYIVIIAAVLIRYNWRVCGCDLRSRQGKHTWGISNRSHQHYDPSRQDKASLGTVVGTEVWQLQSVLMRLRTGSLRVYCRK